MLQAMEEVPGGAAHHPRIPDPRIPAGITREGQEFLRIRRSGDGMSLEREVLMDVRFVSLIGSSSWNGPRGSWRPIPSDSESGCGEFPTDTEPIPAFHHVQI
ncbi:MAG: hypothetical protein EA421_16465 [Gemmatimonadales bacterium]|nr:MAG: hypothetical protein EA421_16465 [Gemmatimonadales bacterium]